MKTKVYPVKMSKDEYDIIQKAARLNETTMADIIRSGALIMAKARIEHLEKIKKKMIKE